jgi:hypothetical protein
VQGANQKDKNSNLALQLIYINLCLQGVNHKDEK